jgi:hypothetical protein
MDALVLPRLSSTLRVVPPSTITPDPLIDTWDDIPISDALPALLQSWPLCPMPIIAVPSGFGDELYLIQGYPIWHAAMETGAESVTALVLSDTPLPTALRNILHGLLVADLYPQHCYYTLTSIRQRATAAGLTDGAPFGWDEPMWRETGIDAARPTEERDALRPGRSHIGATRDPATR